MTRARVLHRLRLLQDEKGVRFTDDEVKAMLCRGLDAERLELEDWEKVVVDLASRLLKDRLSQ